MADNTKIDAGTTGDIIATDDIDGVKVQRVKLMLGADGANDGDVSSENPVPISAGALPLPSGAATEAKQDDIVTAISNKDIMQALKILIQAIVSPAWIDKTANQLRAQVTGTLTTVTTVTGITNFNAYAANLLIIDQNRAAWASVVRSRIA